MPLNAAQIVADALAIAKCPGFTAQGGRALNFVQADLVQHRNLKVNLVSTTINVLANNVGPYNLAADYLRTYEMFYLVNGDPFFLYPVERRQFDADNYTGVGNGYPSEFSTDLSPNANQQPGQLYVWPPSNADVTFTHRYFINRPDIATPETSTFIPWFSDQDYLVQATAARMMRITDDTRYESFVKNCENMLRIHLLTEGDEQQVVKEVQLDPRRFKFAGTPRPTKLDPW
jgi:hypothetical protein